MGTTEAWVLHPAHAEDKTPRSLSRERYELPPIGADQVLVEPLFGCWEANMSHAVARAPIDICAQRGEPSVVIGNAGVVRIVDVGAAVSTTRKGDTCLVVGIAVCDDWGYTVKVLGYDAPNTMGILARQSVMNERDVIPLPKHTRFSLKQWAAFSPRYVTAWSNWRVAHGCWKLQMPEDEAPDSHVWGWGGGTTLGGLLLAKQHGFRVAMFASTDERLAYLAQAGIEAIDRRRFAELAFDETRFEADAEFRARYLAAEETFLSEVRERTNGRGVSIFMDHIGTPVARATLRALARQGVLTTMGWKHGMSVRSVRALECINRHIHVHTHGARYAEAREAVHRAEATGWLPRIEDDAPVYPFSEIPALAADFAANRVHSYFPIYQVNDV